MRSLALCCWLAAGCAVLWAQSGATSASSTAAAGTAPATAAGEKVLGTIHAIAGSTLTVSTDQGALVTLTLGGKTRLLRLAPGQSDWKSATPIQPNDLEVGDRVLARGGDDGSGANLQATLVLVMKRQDVAQLKQEEMADWQLHGVGGLVRQVDALNHTFTIAVSTLGGSREVVVQCSPQTSHRRYAPDSVRWTDAVPARFEQIHPGDQLRARGSRSQDGSQLGAREIVAGSFRNLSGQIVSVDAARQRLTLHDLATRKEVMVAITADSQMRALPPRIAGLLAARLHAAKEAAAKPGSAGPVSITPGSAESAEAAGAGSRGERQRNGGLEQMLARLPPLTVAELHTGDAVMIVSTMGSEPGSGLGSEQGSEQKLPAAVVLLGGVEPLLRAAPENGEGESLLTPWSLAAAPSGE